MVLSANAGGEVREGDCLLLEVGRMPLEGELALVRRGRIEAVCRWMGGEGVDVTGVRGDGIDVVGVVIGIKRKL